MKIVNAVFSKLNGGLEQASLDYARALRSQGNEVIMLVNDRCQFMDDVVAAGDRVHVQNNRLGKSDPLAKMRLRRWLQKEKPDVVVAHGNRAIVLATAAARGVVPVVAVNHTSSVKASLDTPAAITVNDEQKQDLLALGHPDADAIFVVPNMVHVSDAQRQAQVANAPRKPLVIGALARLAPTKGVDVLVDAVAELTRRGVDVVAQVGGVGQCEDELREQVQRLSIAEKVRFVGWVTDRDAFYDALDIYVLPSREETFGIVVLEAFQRKLPVVATDCVGVRFLSAGRDVLARVPLENPLAMADAIEKLAADWPQAQKLAAAGYELVAEKYDIQIVAAQLQKIITHVVQVYAKPQGADA